MREIADDLFAHGRRRPLFVAGPDTQSASLDRKRTFLDYWQSLGGLRPEAIHVAEYASGRAVETVTGLLAGRPPAEMPDALVCENDILAIGAMDGLRYQLGLRVPEDVAVTGFDDIPLTSSPAYELTTYRQPITRMAEELVRVLEGEVTEDVILPGRFIPRAST